MMMMNNMEELENEYSKEFKYTLKSKCGKVLLEQVVVFGSKEKPLPKNYKEDSLFVRGIYDYKEEFFDNHFEITIEEDTESKIVNKEQELKKQVEKLEQENAELRLQISSFDEVVKNMKK